GAIRPAPAADDVVLHRAPRLRASHARLRLSALCPHRLARHRQRRGGVGLDGFHRARALDPPLLLHRAEAGLRPGLAQDGGQGADPGGVVRLAALRPRPRPGPGPRRHRRVTNRAGLRRSPPGIVRGFVREGLVQAASVTVGPAWRTASETLSAYFSKLRANMPASSRALAS